jgi:hypothetical protein
MVISVVSSGSGELAVIKSRRYDVLGREFDEPRPDVQRVVRLLGGRIIESPVDTRRDAREGHHSCELQRERGSIVISSMLLREQSCRNAGKPGTGLPREHSSLRPTTLRGAETHSARRRC